MVGDVGQFTTRTNNSSQGQKKGAQKNTSMKSMRPVSTADQNEMIFNAQGKQENFEYGPDFLNKDQGGKSSRFISQIGARDLKPMQANRRRQISSTRSGREEMLQNNLTARSQLHGFQDDEQSHVSSGSKRSRRSNTSFVTNNILENWGNRKIHDLLPLHNHTQKKMSKIQKRKNKIFDMTYQQTASPTKAGVNSFVIG